MGNFQKDMGERKLGISYEKIENLHHLGLLKKISVQMYPYMNSRKPCWCNT